MSDKVVRKIERLHATGVSIRGIAEALGSTGQLTRMGTKDRTRTERFGVLAARFASRLVALGGRCLNWAIGEQLAELYRLVPYPVAHFRTQ